MPSKRVAEDLNDRMYFLTFTVRNWYSVLDRHGRFDVLLNSLRFCQEQKGLKVFAYVFMINHLHLIIGSPDIAGFIRDFKRHTAQKIISNLKEAEPKVAKLFVNEEGKYELWKKTNMPILIESEHVFEQKKNYIEHNPVRKQYVALPEHWFFSSASPFNTLRISRLDEAGQ